MTKWSYAFGALAAVSLLACAVEKKPPVPEGANAIAQAYIDAWNRHDSTALDTLLAPNAIYEDVAQNLRGNGTAEVVALMRKTIAAQPDFKWKVTNSVEEGRYVALEWTWTSTYSGTDPAGKPVANRRITGRGASVAELENRKVKRFTDYFDRASFFR